MLNKVVLQGRLVADPEYRRTPSGVSLCNFNVAWSEKYGESDKRCFLPCVAWRNTADFLDQYFTKGKAILVEGSLMTEEYEDKSGSKRSITKCMVDKVHFWGGKEDGPKGSHSPTQPDRFTPVSSNSNVELFQDNDDLPF